MKSRLLRVLIISLLGLQVFFYPMTTLAASVPTTDASTTVPSSGKSQTTDAIPSKPMRPETSTYIYNPATGLWENEYYTWDPITKQTQPKTPPAYSYNPVTGMWDTTEYKYDGTRGTYVPQQVSTANPLAAAATPAPAPSSVAPSTTTPKTSPDTGDNIGTSAGTYDLFFNNSISNTVTSKAQSGDASVTHNTAGGNATSGTASSTATVLNMLQSSLGTQPGSITTFTSDIYGMHIGDIHLDPSKLPGSATLHAQNGNTSPDLAINVEQNNTITNNIDLRATSGDANVNSNTSAGNATSGDALAVASVVNVINSSIGTGQSFIGNLNIYGDLDGDILLPENLQQQLLNGTVPTADIDVGKLENSELVADLTTNSLIKNTVNLDAKTGDAIVTSNTRAGDAMSGQASTNLTVLNLTGQEVIGTNAMLVFVNVMGQWVGAIMDAPAGTTTATLGSQDSTITPRAESTAINGTINNTIENNINIQATSGDALITDNTDAGDARSGDATASANLVNIDSSTFSLSDWFGILFINVFGTWQGSFGVDTAAGSTPQQNDNNSTNDDTTRPQMIVFDITHSSDGSLSFKPITSTPGGARGEPTVPAEERKETPEVVLAATDKKPGAPIASTASAKGFAWPVAASIMAILAGLALMGLERFLASRRLRRTHAGQVVT